MENKMEDLLALTSKHKNKIKDGLLVIMTSLLMSFYSPSWAEVIIEKVTEDLLVFDHGENRGLLIMGKQGIAVIDPLNQQVAIEINRFVAKNYNKPITHVIYTHSHWDRITGGEVFKKQGAKFIANKECRLFLSGNQNPDVVEPDVYFDKNYVIELGNQTIELFYFGPSHGECLIVAEIQSANILFIADLLNTSGPTFPNDPTLPYLRPATLIEAFNSMEKLTRTNRISSFITGHASTKIIGSVETINQQRDFWKLVQHTAEEAEKNGNIDLNNFIAMDKINLEPFKQFNNYDQEDLSNILRRYTSFLNMGR
jgi:glyoxylase-like metal-dependent hydrolase (beta-lactamase superfamily II)|tara:strand:- start:10869 stop:11804 length:936 start_codon:yes stop_codon:yes gene_type:complete